MKEYSQEIPIGKGFKKLDGKNVKEWIESYIEEFSGDNELLNLERQSVSKTMALKKNRLLNS